jgi:hypothetical protein
MVKFGTDVSVRIRLATGAVVETVIQGETPFTIHFGGMELQVCEYAMTRINAPVGQLADTVELFLRTPAPIDLGAAERLNRELRRKMGFPVVLSFEDGWWFATDLWYPFYNRFLPHYPPPSFAEFKQHTRVYCDGTSTSGCM